MFLTYIHSFHLHFTLLHSNNVIIVRKMHNKLHHSTTAYALSRIHVLNIKNAIFQNKTHNHAAHNWLVSVKDIICIAKLKDSR